MSESGGARPKTNQTKVSKSPDENKDVIIKGVLTNIFQLEDDYEYNVSDFLRKCHAKPNKWIANVKSFARELDTKVHVDASDPRYKTIYQDTNTIIERFCDILRNDLRFKNATLRRTGSIESGVKVGLPHESDLLLELENLDAFNNEHITVTPCESNKDDAMEEFRAMLSDIESPSKATLFQRTLFSEQCT